MQNLPWEVVSYEQPPNAFWDPLVPDQLVIPRDGLWQLTGGLVLVSLGLTADVRSNLQHNGLNVGGQRLNNVGQNTQLQSSSTLEAAAGDVVRLVIAGGGGTVVPTRATNLSAIRIGPVRWTSC